MANKNDDCISQVVAAILEQRALKAEGKEPRKTKWDLNPDEVKAAASDIADKIAEIRSASKSNSEFISNRDAWLKKQEILSLEQQLKVIQNTKKMKLAFDRIMQSPEDQQSGWYTVFNKAFNEMNGLKSQFQSSLLTGLRRSGLVKIAQKGDLDRDVLRAIEAISMKKSPQDLKIAPEAIELAKIYHETLNGLYHIKKDGGLNIGFIEKYIIPQRHDRELIRATKMDVWVQDISKHIDYKETFDIHGTPTRAELDGIVIPYLEDTYKKITENRGIFDEDYNLDLEMGKDKKSGFERKNTYSRKIIFKDADNLFEYNQKYNGKTVLETVFNNIDSSTRAATMAATFGSNPKNAYATIKKRLADQEIEQRSTVMDKAKSIFRAPDQMFKVLDGTVYRGGDSTGNQVAHALNSLQRAALLGKATLATLTDINFSALALDSKFATGFAKNFKNVAADWAKNLSREERIQLAEVVEFSMNMEMGQQFQRFSSDGVNESGRMARAADAVVTLTGLKDQSEIARMTSLSMMAKTLGMFKDLDIDGLNKATRNTITEAGFDANDWNVLRSSIQEFQGHNMVSMSVLNKESLAAAYKAKHPDGGISLVQYERELRKKFSALQQDMLTYSSPAFSLSSATILTQGLSKDKSMRNVLDLVSLFKSFPLTAAEAFMKSVEANNKSGRGYKGFTASQMQFAIYGIGMGYVVLFMKDIAAGREPRDFNAETIKESFIQSGVAGLWGDMILSGYDKQYRNAVVDTLGPNAGSLADVGSLISSTLATAGNFVIGEEREAEKDMKASMKKLIKFTKRHTPFGNALGVEKAYNYLLMDGLQRWVDPQYHIRAERRFRERGQNPLF